MLFPVYVETGSKSVLTCAFLDQGSTTSLCANRLLNLLDISGEPTKFSVTTVTDCSTLRKGEKVNLTVRSLTGDEINLQNVLSVDQLPVVPNPALTRDEFEAWPHLQDLDLPAAHGEVLLLIGLDTPEAFWVKEERRGSAKEPYAVRGVLGWSVVGPRTTAQGNLSEGDDSISVNFLNTSDLPAEFEIVKQTVAGTEVAVSDGDMEERFARFSSFYRLKRTVARILRLKGRLLRRPVPTGPLTVDEMHQAEMTVIAAVQREAFPKDYRRLETQNSPGKIVKLSLQKLNPIHVAGVLRVGGRLRNAPVDFDAKHPIIMPANSQVTRLLIEQCHKDVGHSGSSHTWSVLRERYWILKGADTVRKILGKCIFCQRRNSAFGKQYMADLPSCRVTPGNPPFFFTGIDYFGPIMVKQGRNRLKRYGCVFTCLTMRAVHLEMSYSLDTDAFINAFRRFISRRGNPHTIYSDNGTNLVGGYLELKRSLKDLDQSTISDHLNRKEIRWRFNPPYASHMGGIWERVIRSIKRVLSAICSEQALTDDVLLTLFAEAEHIVNSRPLTPVVLDHEGGVPLSPNHLLLLRAEDHSIGTFNHRDNYVRRRWRQVQYLTDQFWLRWRKESLQTLQTRQKWQDVEPNFAVDDLVLVSDENSTRGKWPLGRVVQTFPDKFGHVRQVLVRTQNKTLKRSITKLCKLDR